MLSLIALLHPTVLPKGILALGRKVVVLTKADALTQIARRIRGCYGSVDLNFALHPSDEEKAKELRKLSKDFSLSAIEISDSIAPAIRVWLEGDYYPFNKNKPEPWSTDAAKREVQVSSMVSLAVTYFTT